MADSYRSRIYTDRPAYADFDAPAKFTAIQSIIARRLREHPNAICSYSGGSDSDILIHLVETTRQIFRLSEVKYCFFNTGLEMAAIKDHVKETAAKYGVDIEIVRPTTNIVNASMSVRFEIENIKAQIKKLQEELQLLECCEDDEVMPMS